MAYDADGDAIMTDAATGLPITYGASKRSRSASDEVDGGAAPAPLCPPAPKKAASAPTASAEPDGEDGDGAASAVQNLAERMAEVVLEGEPRDDAAELPSPIPPVGDGPAEVGPDDHDNWCLSVNIEDLALRLDMRHPRVVLNLLRFVSTYNELAPEGEEIRMPLMGAWARDQVLNHVSLVNPVPEFASEIAELRALVHRYSCDCADCEPQPERYSEPEYDSDDSYYSGPRYRRGSF